MDFDAALYAALKNDPNQTLRHRRIIKLLERPESNWRRKALVAALESHAREKLGVDHTAQVDWSGTGATPIDWNALLQFFLTQLWPLILKLLGL